MAADVEPHVDLGGVTIWLPTAGDARCSIFEDLADRLGTETNGLALERLLGEWRARGLTGRLDTDHEADGVSVRAGRDAIFEVAMLIDALTVPALRVPVSPEEAAAARERIRRHKRPPRVAWVVGDVFAVPLPDDTFAFGQVLWEDTFAPGSGLRAPTCALFDHRAPTKEVDLLEVVTSTTVAVLHVASAHLDGGRWAVVGRHAPVSDPFSGPCGRPGAVGSRSWDGLDELARAWHGLGPWNAAYRDDWLDAFLMPGVRRPARAVMLGREALEALGIAR